LGFGCATKVLRATSEVLKWCLLFVTSEECVEFNRHFAAQRFPEIKQIHVLHQFKQLIEIIKKNCIQIVARKSKFMK
jgi:hypothetical protein